ncbi:hypothetical protein SAMN05421753_106196 [Planctomicrobium piriforme]|uniref:Uncharacterized protein n=1 Tax=Planctomicrobium piriforme TaxID=1576369 RepID=A0A1I3G5Q6_9PLAN|nr:hypothetical protein SAMN05421753_106196 [Planctomicrobium piriforme]
MVAIRSLTIGVFCCLLGCLHPGGSQFGTAQVPVTNPLLVASQNEELVWERAVDVLHDFQFEIARENRLGRVIETVPKVGSGLTEPWQHDSVGFDNRLESSLQSIRRIVLISLQPDDRGQGYLVSVEAQKEVEDLPGIAGNSPGAATFSESTPLIRDLNPVVGQSSPSRWIPLGRDLALEQAMLNRLRAVYSW